MSERRRLYLTVALKSLALIGVTALALVMIGGLLPDTPKIEEPPPQTVKLTGINAGEMVRLQWGNRPLLVLHRTPEQITTLQQTTQALADPQSLHAQQPQGLEPHTRSLDPLWFIAYANGTGMGCPLAYLPRASDLPAHDWQGGFRDPCDQSLYDLAGRALPQQASDRNIAIPPYRFIDNDTVILGTP